MVSLRWMRGASPFYCPFFRTAVLGQPFRETSPAGHLFIVCQLIRWRGPLPPTGRLVFLGAVGPCYAPPQRPALFNLRADPPHPAVVPARRAAGERPPCSRRRRQGFNWGGKVSAASRTLLVARLSNGVRQSAQQGAAGGRVAAGRGRVPPYGPQAGLGRNASPPGVPPSPR